MRLFPSIGVSLRILKRFNQIVHPMSTTSDTNTTEITTILRNIYSSSPRNIFSCSVTGGGAELLHWLFTVPGASNSVIDACVPYSRESLNKLVGPIAGEDFSGSCSSETALVMAKAAYHNTFNHLLSGDVSLTNISESNVFGVACTAALVSDRPKKGAHRFHIGIYSKDSSITYSVELDKSKLRSRLQEDRVCSRTILDAIALSCNIPLPKDSLLLSQQRASQLSAEEIVGNDEHTGVSTEIPVVKQLRNPSLVESIERVSARKATHTLFINKPDLTPTTHNTATDNNGDKIDVSIATQPALDQQQEQLATQFVCVEGAQIPPNSIVYSGSFNPLHIGHISLVRAEIELTIQKTLNETSNNSTGAQTTPAQAVQQPLVIFELPVVNADKPALPAAEVTRRLLQFHSALHPLLRGLRYAVCITSEPLFVGKSSIFKSSRFVIGADTFSRLIDSKYYKSKNTVTTTTDSHNNSGDVNVQERENTKAMLNMIAALTTIKNNNCTFVVGGRVKQNAPAVSATTTQQPPVQQVFETLESIVRDTEVCRVLPESVLGLFRGLSESQFRLDLSSTEIRNKMKQK